MINRYTVAWGYACLVFVPYADQKWSARCAIPLHLSSAVQGDKHHGGLMPCPGHFSIPHFRLHSARNHWVFNAFRAAPHRYLAAFWNCRYIWQGLSQLSTKPHVLPTKGQDVQDFLEEHYFFMLLRIAKCTVLLLQHKPHYSYLWLSLLLEEYWELLTLCAAWPGRRIRSVGMLIHIWLWTRDFGRGLWVQWHLPTSSESWYLGFL